VEPNNKTRANRAEQAVIAYLGEAEAWRIEGDSPESWDEVIRDLISDLGHLFVREVRDPLSFSEVVTYNDAVRRGYDMFKVEDEEDD
jgi:hypothetical protein